MAQYGFWEHRLPHPIKVREEAHKIEHQLAAVVNEMIVGSVAGLGMFSEAYFLFAIGNIKHIWEVLYPSCFFGSSNDNDGCNDQLVNAVTYVEVCGLIIGMLLFGVLAQTLGRRFCSRATATLMLLGGIVLVAANGPSLTAQFIMFNVGLAVFGIATGGEYPTAATSAAERAELGERKHYERRGRLMVFTFAMQ